MIADRTFSDEIVLDLDFDFDEFVTGYRDRHGSYRVGQLEVDPEMNEYEEIIELGSSLRHWNECWN